MKTILFYLSVALLLTSCEDVIQIELEDMKPRLVIEGVINDLDNQCIIKLSKTTDYFNPGINPAVPNAIITLSDNNGNLVDFNELTPGVYSEAILQGQYETDYTLKIVSEGEEYIANASIPKKVSIDSLSYYYNPESLLYEAGWVVSCHFDDPIDTRDYYRLIAYNINDLSQAKSSQDLYDDEINNGNTIELPWGWEGFQPQDTVIVELQTLDKGTYLYYKTLFSISGESLLAPSSPSNPETNISNGALGFFGAYTVSRDTIVIVPSY